MLVLFAVPQAVKALTVCS